MLKTEYIENQKDPLNSSFKFTTVDNLNPNLFYIVKKTIREQEKYNPAIKFLLKENKRSREKIESFITHILYNFERRKAAHEQSIAKKQRNFEFNKKVVKFNKKNPLYLKPLFPTYDKLSKDVFILTPLSPNHYAGDRFKNETPAFQNLVETLGLNYKIVKASIRIMEELNMIKMDKGFKKFKPLNHKNNDEKPKEYTSTGDSKMTSIRVLPKHLWKINFEFERETSYYKEIKYLTKDQVKEAKNLSGYDLYKKNARKKGAYLVNKNFDYKGNPANPKKNTIPLLITSDSPSIDPKVKQFLLEEEKSVKILNNRTRKFYKTIYYWRVFGKNKNEYGRYYSNFHKIPKKVREKCFPYKEEVDAPQFNINNAFLSITGKLPQGNVYSKLMDALKIPYHAQKYHKPWIKMVVLCIFGSSNHKEGIASIRESVLKKFGLYYQKPEHKDNFLPMYEEAFNHYLTSNSFPDTPLLQFNEAEIIEAFKSSFPELNSIMFKNINPFCQNDESNILKSLLPNLKKDSQPPLLLHDCILVNTNLKEKYQILLYRKRFHNKIDSLIEKKKLTKYLTDSFIPYFNQNKDNLNLAFKEYLKSIYGLYHIDKNKLDYFFNNFFSTDITTKDISYYQSLILKSIEDKDFNNDKLFINIETIVTSTNDYLLLLVLNKVVKEFKKSSFLSLNNYSKNSYNYIKEYIEKQKKAIGGERGFLEYRVQPDSPPPSINLST